MKTDHDILAKIDRDSGMTVPDGYFADFASRMEAAIPANRPKIAEAPRSFWRKSAPMRILPPCLPEYGACSRCST